ncbi:ankyrin repeat domain-containing protein SOWAHA-like [Pimephales promelas]|uniref:ankyrin repeat domain-containing protein SOWAHA-like n=1 Tax=Pimephales promelas TaxID=90988 RepID=UPI001955ABF7|nr:ankyrin repeat domain-containing protein SOWAHA-like [Pimephales promelas]
MFLSNSEMALTQEAILNTLLEGRGKVKNSELLSKFKEHLNCADPAEKKQNRDLFKACVNNIAFVKEFQETKYVVLRKVYHHLLKASSDDNEDPEEDEKEESKKSETEVISPIESALGRCTNVDFTPKRSLNFTVPLKSDDKHRAEKTNKPCALPLRIPQDQTRRNPSGTTDSERERQWRRTTTDGEVSDSPQVRRHFKTPKPADEPKEQSEPFSLDPAEHEWLVKSAAGQWSHVYGLLLKDAQLAEKKDFTSGFTALHWAAKSGNTDMVRNIIQVSRRKGHGVDIDAKSNGGYTALHIAAIHTHTALIDVLVREYGANGNIRDNCGKKPYHYLRKDASGEVRELLGEPRASQQEAPAPREECDPHKHPKIRLFPTYPVGIKKKSKPRFQLMPLGEDDRAERDEPVSHKQRLATDAYP